LILQALPDSAAFNPDSVIVTICRWNDPCFAPSPSPTIAWSSPVPTPAPSIDPGYATISVLPSPYILYFVVNILLPLFPSRNYISLALFRPPWRQMASAALLALGVAQAAVCLALAYRVGKRSRDKRRMRSEKALDHEKTRLFSFFFSPINAVCNAVFLGSQRRT